MAAKKSCINIEANAPISAKSVNAIAKGIVRILQAGHASHADQATTQTAITGFVDLTGRARINGTTISNSNFKMSD